MTDTIKIYLAHPDARPPERKTPGAVGYDICAVQDYDLRAYWTAQLIDTGVVVVPPPGHHVEILLRSSLGKAGVILANSVGLVDQDYCGPTDTLKLALRYMPNLMDSLSVHGPYVTTHGTWTIKKSERIGQLVVRQTITPEVEVVDMVSTINRGGFGSTGKL